MGTVAARVYYPDTIERAKDQTLSLEVYDGANPATMTAATLTIYKADGTKAVDGQAATVATGVVSYALTAAEIPATDSYSNRWREEWTVTVAGAVHTLRRDARLVPLALYPVVTDTDLEARYTELQHQHPDGRDSWQHQTDEAWRVIMARLYSDGHNPASIITPWSLRAAHVSKTLCGVFGELSMYDQSGRYTTLAEAACKAYEDAWSALVFDVDEDNDGDADAVAAASGPILAHAGRKRGGFGW